MYQIEKNIPLPKATGLADVMRKMEIGDSVVLNESDRLKVSQYAKMNAIKMKTKTVNGVLRMWRTE